MGTLPELKILAWDDKPLVYLEPLKAEIERLAPGARVQCEDDPKAFLKSFESRERFNAFILDMQLKDEQQDEELPMEGLRLAKEIRRLDKDSPIAFVTHYATNLYQTEAAEPHQPMVIEHKSTDATWVAIRLVEFFKATLHRVSRTPKKPRVFIGSSKEGLDLANAIQASLSEDAECVVWNQGLFELRETALAALDKGFNRFDFAIFVFSPDDVVSSRSKRYKAIRDNVIFEAGLFMGKHGRDRVFLVAPEGNYLEKLKIPSDLFGVTLGSYEQGRSDELSGLEPAVGKFCNQARLIVRRFARTQ